MNNFIDNLIQVPIYYVIHYALFLEFKKNIFGLFVW